MVIVNHFGEGRAIYLNIDVSGYAFDRLNPKAPSTLPDLMTAVLSSALIQSRVRVLGPDGKRVPGTEVVIFNNGSCEVIAVFRNPQLDDGGWGSYRTKKMNWRDWTADADNSPLEKEVEVTIEWNSAASTYDVRGKKDLGSVAACRATLNPWEPLVFTRATHPLPELQITVPSTSKAGSMLEVVLTSDQAHPQGTLRVVHSEFANPSGELSPLYAQNVIVSSLPHRVQVPLALNDPQGSWKIQGHDILSGRSLQATFTVTHV